MSDDSPENREVLERLSRLEARVEGLAAALQEMQARMPSAFGQHPGSPGPQPMQENLNRPVPPRGPYIQVQKPTAPRPAASKPINPIIWIATAGSILFLIGAAFFLHWSIQRGWLGPELRFLMGLVGGGAISALAARTMLKDNARLGIALLLAGLGTLIFTFRWGAFEYHFFPPAFGFVATLTCVLLAGGLSARIKSGGALSVALIAGFLAPLIFSTGNHHEVVLAVYLTVLMGGCLAIPYVSGVGGRWMGSRWLALTGTWALMAGACLNARSSDAPALLALLAFHLLLSGLWIWLPRQGERPSSPITLWALAQITCTALVAYLWRQELHWMPEALSVPILGLAALNLALVKPVRARLDNRQADFGLLALSAAYLALAVPVALDWRWVGPLWGVFALGMAWAAGHLENNGDWEQEDIRALRRLAVGLALAATLRWLTHGTSCWDFSRGPVLDLPYGFPDAYPSTYYPSKSWLTPFFNTRFAEGALSAAAWALLIRAGGAFRTLGALGLQLVGGITLSLELAHLTRHLGGSFRTASIVLTLTWAILGASQWLLGLKRSEYAKALMAAGYTWLGLASVKLIFIDLAHSNTPVKALAFLGVGAIFLTAALVGNKLRSEESNSGEGNAQ